MPIEKQKEKSNAVALRKDGFSYNEILKIVPVAKSTLSLWLRSVGLARKQKQRLTMLKMEAALRGAKAKKVKRQIKTIEIKNIAIRDIRRITKRELWLIGVALYWAEGSKQKEHLVSQQVRFSNSDPLMIKLFLRWLSLICGISLDNVEFELYIHKTADIKSAQKFWLNVLRIPSVRLQKVRIKKNKINTKRKNIGKQYHGLISIRVRRSTDLNRRIDGWIEGICKYCGVV